MEAVSDDDLCWIQLENFRMLLIKNIDPSKITPYLRQCQVISADDEEQLFNDPNLVIRRRKVGALMDILQRTGVKGYTAFLESLELDYPQLYTRITGKEPNKTFSILIDTAGESGLTQFLMSELSRLQRALQDERRRRQQACAVAKEQEEWSRKQQQREVELTKLSERVQKLQEERRHLSEEVKQLQNHNYSLMTDTNALNQEKTTALLANKDLQIQVERMKNTVLRAESQTRLLRRRTQEVDRGRSLALHSTDMFFHHNRPDEQKEEKQEKKEEKKEEKQEEKQSHPQTMLLTTVFRLRRDLHRAEEQRSRCQEEKEELELRVTQLKGDAKMYRQRHQQTLRHMEEVMRERDKALTSCSKQQEEVRLLLQEKDQYREQVRQLTEQCDKLELTHLHRITCNKLQCETSVCSEDEEEEPTDDSPKVSYRDVQSRTSAENKEAVSLSGNTVSTASWSSTAPGHPDAAVLGDGYRERVGSLQPKDESDILNCSGRPNFFYRRKRALRSKCHSSEYTRCALDDSSDMTDSETSQKPNRMDLKTSQKPSMTDSETSQ